MTTSPKEAIYHVLRSVPPGKVATYGQVAKLAGLGKAARYVGTTLKKLPSDTQLPWHRVIGSQGKISLPVHHPSRARQQSLLLDEGVAVIDGKIDLKVFLWKP